MGWSGGSWSKVLYIFEGGREARYTCVCLGAGGRCSKLHFFSHMVFINLSHRDSLLVASLLVPIKTPPTHTHTYTNTHAHKNTLHSYAVNCGIFLLVELSCVWNLLFYFFCSLNSKSSQIISLHRSFLNFSSVWNHDVFTISPRVQHLGQYICCLLLDQCGSDKRFPYNILKSI